MRVKLAGSGAATGRGAENSWLDRWPWLPVLLLLLFPLMLHVPVWLLGRTTDPLWRVSGLTMPSTSLPGFPWIDPNVGFTSEALGRLAAWDWVHGIVPWWNPYTGVGMPLAGELQPGAFFFPFNLLFLLREGVLWQQMAMQMLAGLATYALLRQLRLSRLACLMGGALYAVNGTIAWTPGPAAVYCGIPFFPMLLWGIERAARDARGAASVLAVGVSIGWSILSGFPEPAYISGLLGVAWAVYRLVQTPVAARWRMVRRGLAGLRWDCWWRRRRCCRLRIICGSRIRSGCISWVSLPCRGRGWRRW